MTKRFGAVLVALMLLLLAVTPTAGAGPKGTERPFKGWATGEATFLLENPLGCPAEPAGGFGITTATDAWGNASHLGNMSLHGDHCPLLDGGIIEGTMVFFAANGDELHTTYEGAATLLPPNIGDPIYVTVYMTVDPAASTGRFVGAEGEIVLDAELVFEGIGDPAWPWAATWTGTLSY